MFYSNYDFLSVFFVAFVFFSRFDEGEIDGKNQSFTNPAILAASLRKTSISRCSLAASWWQRSDHFSCSPKQLEERILDLPLSLQGLIKWAKIPMIGDSWSDSDPCVVL